MKLINPLDLAVALVACLVCLLYGSVPHFGKRTVNYFAPNGFIAVYKSDTGACMISAPSGCGVIVYPRRQSRIVGLRHFIRYVKLAHKGTLSHD